MLRAQLCWWPICKILSSRKHCPRYFIPKFDKFLMDSTYSLSPHIHWMCWVRLCIFFESPYSLNVLSQTLHILWVPIFIECAESDSAYSLNLHIHWMCWVRLCIFFESPFSLNVLSQTLHILWVPIFIECAEFDSAYSLSPHIELNIVCLSLKLEHIVAKLKNVACPALLMTHL